MTDEKQHADGRRYPQMSADGINSDSFDIIYTVSVHPRFVAPSRSARMAVT